MKSSKIEGIKSVDFKIIAKGHGVVNWNGPTSLKVQEDSKLGKSNHTMPKLRGYSNLTGEKSDKGFNYLKEPTDIDFTKTPLYISQNCIRHHLFRENSLIDIQSKEVVENLDKLLCSMVGLVRGYVIPLTENKRTSALLLEDFVDQFGNGNFEQLTKSGKRNNTSFYSKTTFGDTKYISYGSISIEQLQFISLDSKFARQSITYATEKDRKKLAEKMTIFLNELDDTDKAEAKYHDNYVRNGSIYDIGEAGILLNEEAIDILVKNTLVLFKNLIIRQAKGYMYVDSIEIDYNNGSSAKDMMRIKREPSSIKQKDTQYAQYFTGI